MLKLLLGAILPFAVFTSCGYQVIDAGHRGVKVNLGTVEKDAYQEGLYFYNPFTSSLVEMNVQERKTETNQQCYSKDLQRFVASVAITYFPKPENTPILYKNFGIEWENKIVPQVISGVVKDITGRYDADDLVNKREQARKEIEELLGPSLEKRNITLTRFDIINIDFDDQYEEAIEAKVVAIQNAERSKNETVQIKEEAQQKIIQAEAEARSMLIKTEALSKNKSLVEYEAVQKWDGKLPEFIGGGAVPFINFNKKSE